MEKGCVWRKKRHHAFKITKERAGGNVSTVPNPKRNRRACSEITVREKTRAVRGEREHAHALRVESRPSSAGEPRRRDIHIDIWGISGR